MPRKALRCRAEITIHAVTCPGVWLPRRDDVYISVCMFGQVRRSSFTAPVFPLLFHEKFTFDKVFYSAFEPAQVAEALDNHWVTIEVIQLSDIYDGGRLLASFDGNVRDFLYPFPTYSPMYGTQDREVLLDRSLDFPGISPKLEFSTRTTIEETSAFISSDDELVYTPRTTVRTSRSRSRTKNNSRARSPYRYQRPTIASISRSRSMSPSRRMADLLIADDDTATDTLRPDFVVRKCDSGKLLGRVPGHPGPAAQHGFNRKRRMSTGNLYDDNDFSYTKPARTYRDDTYVYDSLDDEIAALTTSRVPYRSTSPYRALSPYRGTSSLYRALSPYRSTSPYRSVSPYRQPISPYYDTTTSDLISRRVDRALARNRSLERIDRLASDWVKIHQDNAAGYRRVEKV